MTADTAIPTVPRWPGDPAGDIAVMKQYLEDQHRTAVIESKLLDPAYQANPGTFDKANLPDPANTSIAKAQNTANNAVALAGSTIATGRKILSTATTYTVDPVNGSDSNDGTTAPFKTIQQAFDYVIGRIDCAFTPTIKLVDGTYVEMVFASAAALGKANTIQVVGNVATPANVVWKLDGTIVPPPGSTPVALVARGGVSINVSGIAFTSVGTINATFLDAFNASISFDHCDFGPALGTQSHILVGNGALISQNGPYTISGGSGSHIILLNGSFVYIGLTATVTVTVPVTMSLCFALVDHGYLLFDGTTTFTLTGAVTGTKYIADFGGSIFLNSSVLPGSVNGQLLNGGNIAP